ncbi:MAG: class I SAM-dependent methyltransferase [Burkholderiales bacterium]|nr:class I SAM-dependent methyltransferase [Burkholderiales bacterium]
MSACPGTLRALLAGACAAALLLPQVAAAQGGDAPYVPTPQVVVDAMLRMARVGPGDYLIDLGSGDGRIVITAAKRYGARGLGVDLDASLLALANDAAGREGVAGLVDFRRQDLFETDLAPATVITSYLLPEMNLKLRSKLLALAPGTRIVAHDYHFGDWPPDERQTLRVPEKKVGDPGTSYVYLWVVPAQVAGRWRTEVAAGDGNAAPIELEITQSFQAIGGHAVVGARRVPLHGAHLQGADIHFAVDVASSGTSRRHSFRGRAAGDAIVGVVSVREAGAWRERDWRAARVAAPP